MFGANKFLANTIPRKHIGRTDPIHAPYGSFGHCATFSAVRCPTLALADVAGTLTHTDPDRAARLLTDADHAAQWIIQDRVKIAALAHIVQAWHRV